MKIVFSGGGTLGPVTPLLAIAKIYKDKYPKTEFVWIGTKNGPEKELVEKFGMRFVPLTSGKWRRYFSVFNIFDLFKIFFEKKFCGARHPCAISEIAGDGCQGTSPLLESTAEQHETCACM